MKFSDHIERTDLESVYVIRTNKEMYSREEANSYLFEFKRSINTEKQLFKIPVRDVKISESIYDSKGEYITYRTS